ncbi:MAG: hypothetical protein IH599_03560 [Bacteroidales bacterium]|nr:hypothetical protein [Bacteroidales bacterium]
MNRSAAIFMIVSQVIITGMALFFFMKVLFTKPRPEPDTYTDNDEEER